MARTEPLPFTVCHMLASLDGRIEGNFFSKPGCSDALREYGALRSTFKCGALLYGTTTALEFAGGEAGKLPRPARLLPYSDYKAGAKERDYLVAIDARGRIGWKSRTFSRPGRPDAHIIEVLTERAAPEYLEYLREHGISYIIAGKSAVSFKILLRKLNEIFGIERVMLAGGGLINGAMLDAGCIDELSVVVAPVVDGGNGAALFAGCKSAGLKLIETRELDGGAIWLRYSVK